MPESLEMNSFPLRQSARERTPILTDKRRHEINSQKREDFLAAGWLGNIDDKTLFYNGMPIYNGPTPYPVLEGEICINAVSPNFTIVNKDRLGIGDLDIPTENYTKIFASADKIILPELPPEAPEPIYTFFVVKNGKLEKIEAPENIPTKKFFPKEIRFHRGVPDQMIFSETDTDSEDIPYKDTPTSSPPLGGTMEDNPAEYN